MDNMRTQGILNEIPLLVLSSLKRLCSAKPKGIIAFTEAHIHKSDRILQAIRNRIAKAWTSESSIKWS